MVIKPCLFWSIHLLDTAIVVISDNKMFVYLYKYIIRLKIVLRFGHLLVFKSCSWIFWCQISKLFLIFVGKQT